MPDVSDCPRDVGEAYGEVRQKLLSEIVDFGNPPEKDVLIELVCQLEAGDRVLSYAVNMISDVPGVSRGMADFERPKEGSSHDCDIPNRILELLLVGL